MNLLAIDPGLKGGIAAIYKDGSITAVPMPVVGKVLDLRAISIIVRDNDPAWIVIEKVGARPGQGVTSMFTFGMGYGAIQGIAAALAVPVELVTPQRWKSTVLHGTAKDKASAIAFCRRVFPDVALVLPRCKVPHDGLADSLCLLEYGRRVLKG